MPTYRAVNVSYVRGTNKTLLAFVQQPDPTDPTDLTKFTAMNLTGYKGRFTVKLSPTSTTCVVKKATANVTGGSDTLMKILTPATDGKVEVYLLPADFPVATYASGNYFYEVDMEDSTGKHVPVLQGTLTLLDHLTDWTVIP